MTLKKVLDGILSQAHEEEKRIVSQAQQEASSLEKEARKKADKLHAKTKKKTLEFAQEFDRKEISATEILIKKKSMKFKRDVVRDIMEKTFDKIKKMPKKQKEKVLENTVKIGLNELPDAKFFYSNKEDKKFVMKAFPELSFSGEIECLGGVILENADKTIRVDQTFEIILERIKEENFNELAKNLFE